ncbi:hypothetical protein HG263_14600 [Pseudoalteromonas sp. JBTF-M23]|uniref:Surface carbohydrate biosynthesis protein n=1 Tax=Pseudoalteromonas caenipelagi TaxID=2726988 RepID=A0A849VIW4_9GAMM|nr:hypothetical protein [Pseudoalteromonas caenipelagi]
MIQVDFLFLVEHEDREMSSVKRLKSELEMKGCSCIILSTEFHAHLFNQFNARNIVFPYAIDDATWPIRAFKRQKFKKCNFISLNWEQLLSKSNQDFKKPKSRFIQEHFYHLAWEDNFKEFLKDSGSKSDNIRVIGNPLHELLMEDLYNSSLYDGKLRAEFGIEKSSELYFFPMNYGWAFFSDDKIKAKIAMGYDSEVAYEYRDYALRCLNAFTYFITKLCALYPKSTFVVRPHPSISVEQYVEKFTVNGLTIPVNMVLTKRYTIKEWIAISQVVGSSWSTSVWDAQKVGKKGFLFTPFERPDWLDTFWNKLVINISEPEDFEMVLNSEGGDVSDVGKITLSISSWLYDIHSSHLYEKEIKSDIYSEIINFSYRARAKFRVFSMNRLNGMGVGKGLQRDYFFPVE